MKNKIIPSDESTELSKLSKVSKGYADIAKYASNEVTSLSPLHLRLNNISNTRRSLAAVIRATSRNVISHEQGRSFSYMIQSLCSAYKTECELLETKQLIKDIAELKEALNARN